MRDSLSLLTASAALLLAACGGARPQVKTAPPAAAPSSLPSPVAEYKPGPAPAVQTSTSAAISLSTAPSTVAVATAPAVNAVPREPPAPLSSDANIVILVAEAVGGPEQDLGSYTKIFIDNSFAGQTQKAAKSVEKRWGARLDPGNHLFRFEKWDLPTVGDWAPLDVQWQPPERFIRVDPGSRTVVRLKFYDAGRGRSSQISREPLSAPLP